MKKLQKIISLVLVLSMILTTFNVSLAETDTNEEKSIDEKADVINELGILRGDGTSYNLDATLKRSEAVAFITRFIMKEEEINANKDTYKFTQFEDVSPDNWYAPYVGYCVEAGILNGYDDNTFRPNNELSEQAFLKMVLVALGYDYDLDFFWSTVYNKAFKVGLIDYDTYTEPVKEDLYKRGSVVEALYKSLDIIEKQQEKKVIYNFIEKDKINPTRAAELGLIDNAVELEIVEQLVKNRTTIQLTFNEEIKDITIEQVNIFTRKQVAFR